MTSINYTPERIKGKHLPFEEKEEILHYKEKCYSMRHIAKIIGVTPQTIINEINRGTVKQAKTVAGKVKHYSKYSPIYS